MIEIIETIIADNTLAGGLGWSNMNAFDDHKKKVNDFEACHLDKKLLYVSFDEKYIPMEVSGIKCRKQVYISIIILQ